jgi:hypothetical protein
MLAERLINSSFVKETKEKDPQRHYTWIENKQTRKLDFSYRRDKVHDQESIMAFILTLRQIIQDRDPTSIKKMAKLYDDMPIDPSYKTEFHNRRNRLNDYLASPALTTTADDPTMGEILRTVIYGEYAHMEDAKRDVLKRWQKYAGDWDMILGEFEAALYRCCVDFITPMKELNERVLKQYASSP